MLNRENRDVEVGEVSFCRAMLAAGDRAATVGELRDLVGVDSDDAV